MSKDLTNSSAEQRGGRLRTTLRFAVVVTCIAATMATGMAAYQAPSPGLLCVQNTTWVGGKPVFTTGQISVVHGLANNTYVDDLGAIAWEVQRWDGAKWAAYRAGSAYIKLPRATWSTTVISLPYNLGGFPQAGSYRVKLALGWNQNGTAMRWSGFASNGAYCQFIQAG